MGNRYEIEQSPPSIQSAPELNSLQNNAGSVPVTLTANELSAILSWMTPPYITSGTHTDEFNELRNKVFYALRDAQNDEPVSQPYKLTSECWCLTCRPVTMNDMRFVVCPDCGNKRCPRANDHRNDCSGSNEPGQAGSTYPAAPQQELKT